MSINAMHAMPEGGTLTLTTRNLHLHPADTITLDIEAGDYVLLSLVDTGEGMNNDTRAKLFDPFFSTKGSNGIGLGMSQVYGFVNQSGGSIQLLFTARARYKLLHLLPPWYLSKNFTPIRS